MTYMPVGTNGIVDLAELDKAMTPDTSLVSIMAVNNEIGVKQPIAEIGAMCKQKKIFFHTDAAQAVGKIPLDVNAMNIDLMSVSGHKIYGPKGIGALYVRRRPRVRLEPIQSGGGQERGLRSGTVPTVLCVGLGEACELATREMAFDHKWMEFLSQRLITKINAQLPQVIRNGDATQTYPGCVNLSFAFVEGESLLMALKDIALSSGSACTSASLEPSYVLRAIGTDEDLAHSSIRFVFFVIPKLYLFVIYIKNNPPGSVWVVSPPSTRWTTSRISASNTFSVCAKCRRYGRCPRKESTSNPFNGRSIKIETSHTLFNLAKFYFCIYIAVLFGTICSKIVSKCI